ncbi:hypothetical protein [Thalassotalea fusca]
MNKSAIVMSIFMLAGCSTSGDPRANQNKIIKEFYATIIEVTPVELSSNIETGVLVGGSVGLIENLDGDTEDMIGGAIFGALIGGIFTSIEEGSNDAFKYALSSEQEGTFTIIQKNRVDPNARCVKVRVAEHVTIYAASKYACEYESAIKRK